ncbi:hypothetical protein ACNKHR_07760 [Shigella flexneri]
MAFIPAIQGSPRQHILRGEQRLRDAAGVKGLSTASRYGLYCCAHRQLMNYEKRLREVALPSTRPMRARQNAIDERFITSPVGRG